MIATPSSLHMPSFGRDVVHYWQLFTPKENRQYNAHDAPMKIDSSPSNSSQNTTAPQCTNKKGKMRNPENDNMCVSVCVLNLILQWGPGSGKFQYYYYLFSSCLWRNMFYLGNFSDLKLIRHKWYVRDPWICMQGSYRCLRGKWLKLNLLRKRSALILIANFRKQWKPWI